MIIEKLKYQRLERAFFNWFNRARVAHPSTTYLSRVFSRYHLNRLEQDILLLLTVSALGLGARISDAHEIQNYLERKHGDRLAILRALDSGGRLVRSGLISVELSNTPAESSVLVDPEFTLPLLKKKGTLVDVWDVSSQEELLKKLYPLLKCYQARASELEEEHFPRYRNHEAVKLNREGRRLEHTLYQTLQKHKQWTLFSLLADLEERERRIVLILLCVEIGYLNHWRDARRGEELAKGISESESEIPESIWFLSSKGRLRREQYIRICGIDDSEKVEDDLETLRRCEFELTPDVLDRLKIKHKRTKRIYSRKPLVTLDHLALHPEVREALEAALTQARHSRTLLTDWGFKHTIHYGRSITLLFSGPPGVGKTACAEAIAHELGKNILVADYSRIQDCFVGETEKNIVRTFRAAREENAILFWDEADAMFYDRDSASRNWEVRDVNVLLQELERFEEICILSTNRKVSLDKALERRISMKIEFKPPTVEMAKEIWKKLLPKKAPLEKDVDLDCLAKYGLTGGEIKNAVLNAARKALLRGPKAKISMEDFRWAVELEKKGGWNEETLGKIGFRPT